MPSGVFDSILLRDSWSTAELRRVFSDENRVQKWYEVEAMLASEQAAFGILPREAAGEIIKSLTSAAAAPTIKATGLDPIAKGK